MQCTFNFAFDLYLAGPTFVPAICVYDAISVLKVCGLEQFQFQQWIF
jgi:hypothetical protein